jgi:hypothetical protein
MEEAPQERGATSEPREFAAHRSPDLGDVIRGEVGEAAVLEVRPQLRNRVEVGRVGREPRDVPAPTGCEPVANIGMSVGPAPIPQQDGGAVEMPTEMPQEAQHGWPWILSLGYSVRASRRRRRRGETSTAPMPETFSCERARTGIVGVWPHGPQVRRSTGVIMNPVSSRQISHAPLRRSFFYSGPLLPHPPSDSEIVPLLGRALRSLRREPTRAKQPADVVRVVRDAEALAHQLDDPPTGPQDGPISRGLGPGKNRPHERPALLGRQLGRSPRRRARFESPQAAPTMRPLPPAHRPPIDAEPLRDDVDRDVALKHIEGSHPSAFELGGTALWSHEHLPQTD